MNFYKKGMETLLEEFANNLGVKSELIQIDNLKKALTVYTQKIENIKTKVSFDFFTDKMKMYIEETIESEKLSKDEFEHKYSSEMNVCKRLGRAGWVISEHTNPRKTYEWYKLLIAGKENRIVEYFECDNEMVLNSILNGLENKYALSENKYFIKAKAYFEVEDYMTTAIYLVALIEAVTNELMKYPKGIKYRQKYSEEGFEKHLEIEYNKVDSFFTKRFLFLEMYPSIIEFLDRLFVDGEYTFERGVEPPYINRNWLLHGKSNRDIERFECIQLFNALSVIEFVFSVTNKNGEYID